MSLSVSAKGGQRTKRKLRGMEARAKNLSPVWPKVGSLIANMNRLQWATDGAYYGTPWQPLSPDYLQWKVSNGYSGSLLVMTGGMRASFTSRPMRIEQYRGNSAVFGSDYWLAKFHHYGTFRNGKRAIPPRKLMVASERMQSGVAAVIAQYVTDGISRTRVMDKL